MSIESFEMPVPVVRQVEIPQPVIEGLQQMEHLQVAQPSQEQARAVAQVFAHRQQEPDAATSLFVLMTAGMLVRDIVTDTLAAPEDDEEEATEPEPTP
jgi:hypothetical protein